MSLRSLALEVDESDGAKRSMALSLLLRAILEGSVNDEASSVGMGPVNLDVEMARAHGWSKEQIDRAWSVNSASAPKRTKRLSAISAAALPEGEPPSSNMIRYGIFDARSRGVKRKGSACPPWNLSIRTFIKVSA